MVSKVGLADWCLLNRNFDFYIQLSLSLKISAAVDCREHRDPRADLTPMPDAFFIKAQLYVEG
jgi:hypothetical protein